MKIFQQSLIILLVAFLCTSASSQKDIENALLWEITHPDTEHSSYLFGTMHALPEEGFSIPEILTEKIAASDVMYQEIDMSNLDQMDIINKMMLPEGKTLKDQLPEKEYKAFTAMLKDFDIPQSQISFLTKMKPIVSYGLIINTFIGKAIILEQELTAIAKEKGTELKGLETIDFQIALFDSIPMSKQINMFFESDFEKEFQQQVKTYKQQDINKMYSSVKSTKYGNIEKQLITRRNKNWADTLNMVMPETPVFVAVGAAHLAGKNGLIPLLKSKGYIIKPVSFEFE